MWQKSTILTALLKTISMIEKANFILFFQDTLDKINNELRSMCNML